MVQEHIEDELSDPITVQMRLPVSTLERLDLESKRTMIPRPLLVRRCVLDHYGRGTLVSEDSTNRAVDVQNIRQSEG